MKTRAIIIDDIHRNSSIQKGDIGYIDAYITNGDGYRYVVFVSGENIEMVSFGKVKPISFTKYLYLKLKRLITRTH